MKNTRMGLWSIAAAAMALLIGACSASTETNSGTELKCGSLGKCGSECFDFSLDPNNCGGCGATCAAGEVCSLGSCASQCGGTTSECDSLCVTLDSDRENCGSCGNSCAAGEVCSAGQCQLECGGGSSQCLDGCVDTNIDPANCGACGVACVAGEVCSQGSCELNCSGGSAKCGSSCVDLNGDAANCGACGNQCPSGLACVAGNCQLSCSSGTTDCSGACVDTNSDPAHCGACDSPCMSPANAAGVCITGSCDYACQGNFLDCNGDPADGCENDGNCPTGGNGVFAFGEFRPALACADFINNGNNYQQYCFLLKGNTYCTGQNQSGMVTCTDLPNGGIKFTYDFPSSWPMRFTANTPSCQNYHPAHIQNFAAAIGYANHTVLQTKTGNSCERTWLDTNGDFQMTTGDSNQAQIYEIDYFN